MNFDNAQPQSSLLLVRRVQVLTDDISNVITPHLRPLGFWKMQKGNPYRNKGKTLMVAGQLVLLIKLN
jgi:hypothetical protein